ncbi:GNAT family N-acetyltransferase [Pseudomonas lalucatii]|uniref:GNAT family N-acetyltransferase n=1 Tax=Pseudomonas lalucatii TaxID=1424203 RepID=A0ABS5PY97_9PSED|nr:GNAT family N-acetyltransferase [Pseudomonas lalucatii]MBS7661478.1 GNAT family N-acetyltransferase [Pseudomonas lalucatii]
MAAIAETIDTRFTLRPGSADDATACGQICYDAFGAISAQHGFPSDFPSAEVATQLLSGLLSHPGFYSVVAQSQGRIAGSNFLDERNSIAGIGPITVAPRIQNQAIGRRLMEDVLQRVAERRFPGVRLLQAAYHNRSLSLYSKLGFVAREPLSTMQGTPPRVSLPGHRVRPATLDDLPGCNRLCLQVHGHDRGGELRDAIAQGTARVVEHEGRIVGYTSIIAFFGHTVGESNDAVKALIAAASEYPGPGFHVPTRNAELFRWCLEHGLRVVQPMTLMTIGLYNEPAGAYLPSILY